MERVVEKYWEFTLYAGDYFLNQYDLIKQIIKKQQGVKSIFCHNEDTGAYVFAVEENQKSYLENSIKKSIIQHIVSVEKSNYLSQNLKKLDILGNLAPIFLKILCLFDTENDILEIEKNLRLNNQLYLKEFYYFKLKKLKSRWQQVCELTNENDFFFSSEELVFQLLRFLLKDCKRKCSSLMLEVSENGIILSKNNGEVLDKIQYGIWSEELETKIVLMILDNLPKEIIVKNKKQFDANFIGLLDLIFKNSLKCE